MDIVYSQTADNKWQSATIIRIDCAKIWNAPFKRIGFRFCSTWLVIESIRPEIRYIYPRTNFKKGQGSVKFNSLMKVKGNPIILRIQKENYYFMLYIIIGMLCSIYTKIKTKHYNYKINSFTTYLDDYFFHDKMHFVQVSWKNPTLKNPITVMLKPKSMKPARLKMSSSCPRNPWTSVINCWPSAETTL